jgi:hypothetical protein
LLTNVDFARALVAIGDVAQALATVEEVADGNISIETMMRIAELRAAVGETGSARDTITKALALAEGVETNSYHHEGRHDVVRGTRVQSCAATIGNRDSAMGQIFETQIRIGEIDSALETADKIEDPYWRAALLSRIAAAPDQALNVATARRVVEVAIAAATLIEDGDCRESTISAIALAQARAGDLEEALVSIGANRNARPSGIRLDQIADAWAVSGRAAPAAGGATPYVRAVILTAIARRKVGVGDVHAARSALDEALAAADDVNEPGLRRMALTRVAGAQAQLGDVAAVERTMREVQRLAQAAGEVRPNGTASSLIAIAQAKSGHPSEALATMDNLEVDLLRVDVLAQIAESLPN